MCWAEKCCYFVPANLGCVLLGICSFIISTFMMAASIACYVIVARQEGDELLVQKPHFAEKLGLDLNVSSVHILLTGAIIVAVLWMIVSVMLIVGIVKVLTFGLTGIINIPCFILCYFTIGIIVTILCQLSALLVLLHNCWIMAIILFISSLLHIHYLVVVHTVYELMQRGKDFSIHQNNDDVDILADCFDENTNTI